MRWEKVLGQVGAISLKNSILFVQNSIGTIRTPYRTYRQLAMSSNYLQLAILAMTVVIYFWLAGLARHGLHPFIVAKSWVLTSGMALISFIFAIGGMYGVGRLLKGHGKLTDLILPWGYSLWPTLLWFFSASVSYVLIPPPRQPTLLGYLFSFLFIVGSLVLFFWKGVLYYLTLRFGMKLDLFRIVITSMIIFPAGILYSLAMYKLGVFRVPFI